MFWKELYFQHSNEKATLDIYSAKSSRPILDREYWKNAEVGRGTAQNWFPQLARLEMNKGPQEGEEFFKQGRMLKAERKLKTNIGLIDPKSWILFSPPHWFVFSKGTLSPLADTYKYFSQDNIFSKIGSGILWYSKQLLDFIWQ